MGPKRYLGDNVIVDGGLVPGLDHTLSIMSWLSLTTLLLPSLCFLQRWSRALLQDLKTLTAYSFTSCVMDDNKTLHGHCRQYLEEIISVVSSAI